MGKDLKSLRARFLANLPFKVAALLIAFLLWFFVHNVVEPVISDTVTVTLELRNNGLSALENPVFLENEAALSAVQVSVPVRGTARDIAAFEQSLRAYIDLSTAEVMHSAQNTDRLAVTVNVSGSADGVSFSTHTPSSVTLNLDPIISAHIDVELVRLGTVAEGYILIEEEETIHPPSLFVTGPSRQINLISRLVVEVDVSDYQDHILLNNYTPQTLGLDGYAANVPNISFSGTVDVHIPVYRRGIATIAALTHDSPALGFGVREITLSNSQFEVFGTAEAIAALQPIQIEELQLGEASVSFSRDFIINNHLPPGIFLVDRLNYRTTANIIIEPITQRSFNISREMINVTGVSTNFNILTEQVTINVTGLASAVSAMQTPTSSLSLAGLEEGEHEIRLNINLPASAQLIGANPVFVVQIGSEQIDDTPYTLDDDYDYPPYETTQPPYETTEPDTDSDYD